MIVEEANSLEEEDSLLYSNELNSAYNAILSSLEEFIDKSMIAPTLKIAKIRSIQQVVESIFSSSKDFTLEKVYSTINSMRSKLDAYKQKEHYYLNTIEDLQLRLKEYELQNYRISYKQSHSQPKELKKNKLKTANTNEDNKETNDNDNGNDNDDCDDNDENVVIKKLKRKLKTKESTFNLREIKYLCMITDQTHKIKELNEKIPPLYDEKELKKAKLFPHLYENNIEGIRMIPNINIISTMANSNSSRNKIKTLTISSSLLPNQSHKNPFHLDHNDDKDKEKGLQTERSHRTKSMNSNLLNPIILPETKSTNNINNYKYYQKNRLVKHPINHKLKASIVEISNFITVHNKIGRFKNIKNVFKQPSNTYYGSFKKV